MCPRVYIKKGFNPWNRGKKMPQSTREKMSLSKRGEKHPNWKGGISSMRLQECNTPKYKAWVLDIYKRDDFTCQMPGCAQRGGKLSAHHIMKYSDHPTLRYELDNGITLCDSCHKKTFWKEESFEKLFKEIINLRAKPKCPGQPKGF